MDFISNTDLQLEAMLAAMGVGSFEDLIQDIPEALRLPRPSRDDGLSEFEGKQWMERLGGHNRFPSFDSYLGGGAYEHYVPALVQAICGKSEFLTAYTPYQGEASQGMLQVLFEYQTAICRLTGMDVANASVYDGAFACVEAASMALRYHRHKRSKILVSGGLHPHYLSVLEQYLLAHNALVKVIPFQGDGTLDTKGVLEELDEDTAALLVQSPNFLGFMEDVRPLAEQAKRKNALTVLCANPLAYGLFQSAGELGADIAVGDTQVFGIPLQFGGPYAGYMACREGLLRQLPGRIVGQTQDREGKRGYVLTLQAREQHIRREKATSSICTSQTLAALAALVTLLWYGQRGLRELALTNFQRSAYVKAGLHGLAHGERFGEASTFNEFVIKLHKPMDEVLAHFRRASIEPGLDLGRYFPQLSQHLLVAVTETKDKEALDRYLATAQEVLS